MSVVRPYRSALYMPASNARALEKAKTLLNQVAAEFPERFEFWLGQGLLFRAQGNSTNAIEAFNKAASLRPESFRAHLEVARAYRELKKERAAKKALASAQQRMLNVRQVLQFKEELKRLETTF